MPTQLNYGQAGNRAYGPYYRHSGRVSLGVVLGVAAAFLLGLAAGIAYGYAVVYVPFILAHLMVMVVYGAALGAIVTFVMRRAGVRNAPLILAVTSAVVVVSYYASWAAWL